MRAVAACRVPTISAVGPRDRLHPLRLRGRPARGDPERRGGTDLERVCAVGGADASPRARRSRSALRGHEPGPGARRPRPLAAAPAFAPGPGRARLPAPGRHVEPAGVGAALDAAAPPPRACGRGRAARAGLPRRRGCRCDPTALLSLSKRLQGASPRSVLNRGFAIMRDEQGRPVIRNAGIKPGQRLEAEFADGRRPRARGRGLNFGGAGGKVAAPCPRVPSCPASPSAALLLAGCGEEQVSDLPGAEGEGPGASGRGRGRCGAPAAEAPGAGDGRTPRSRRPAAPTSPGRRPRPG